MTKYNEYFTFQVIIVGCGTINWGLEGKIKNYALRSIKIPNIQYYSTVWLDLQTSDMPTKKGIVN